ncbi:MAG: hypothetical protein ACJ749_03825, partial [Flavisolibacter sp.]
MKCQVLNSNNLVEKITAGIFSYQLRVTEMGITGGTMGALSAPYTLPDGWTVWDAQQDRVTIVQSPKKFIAGETATLAQFLTDKPNNAKVNPLSTEYLYFLNDRVTNMEVCIDLFDSTGGELTNSYESIPNIYPADSYMYRLNVSPRVIEPRFGYDYTIASYYEVWVRETTTNAQLTEKRRYYTADLPCSVEPINIVWVNSLGGLDAFQFYNPKETVNFQKQTIKRATTKFTGSTYSDVTGKIYNTSEETYDVNRSGTYSATSTFITDAESYWLMEMFRSKQAYVEIQDGYLMPVTIKGDSYEIQRRRHNKSAYNTVTVNFTMPDDYLPLKPLNGLGSTMIL